MCVCYTLCCHPIYSGRQAYGRTSRGHTGGSSHRISHPPSFCGACALNFLREKDFSRSFLSSTVKSKFCVLTISSFSACWAFIFYLFIYLFIYYFFVRKNPSSCNDTEIRNHVPTSKGLRGYQLNHRGGMHVYYRYVGSTHEGCTEVRYATVYKRYC